MFSKPKENLKKIENFLGEHINECIKNIKFGELKFSTIFRIIEENKENVDQDLLVDFIFKSAETHFIILKFVELAKLNKARVYELIKFLEKQEETTKEKYLEHMSFNLSFIKNIINKYEILILEMNQKKQEFNQTKQEFNQTKQELNQTKQEFNQTKQEFNQTKQELNQTKQELNQTKQKLNQTKQDLNQTKPIEELPDEIFLEEGINEFLNDAKTSKFIHDVINEELPDAENKDKERLNSILKNILGEETEIDPSQLSDEDFNKLVEKAKNDKALSDFLQNQFGQYGTTPETLEYEIAELQKDSKERRLFQAELSLVQNEIRQLVSSVENRYIEELPLEMFNVEGINKVSNDAKTSKSIHDVINEELPDTENNKDKVKKSLEQLKKDKERLNLILKNILGEGTEIDPSQLSDEDFNKLVEKAKNDKALSDSLRKQLEQDGSTPEALERKLSELQKDSKELLLVQAELHLVQDKYHQLVSSIENKLSNDAKTSKSIDDIINEELSDIENNKDKERLNLILKDIFDEETEIYPIQLSDEDFNKLVEKAKNDKALSYSLQKQLEIDGITPEILEHELAELQKDSDELKKVQNELRQIANSIKNRPIEELPADTFNDEGINKLSEDAKTSKSIHDVISHHLPEISEDKDKVDTAITQLEQSKERFNNLLKNIFGEGTELDPNQLSDEDFNKLMFIINSTFCNFNW